MNEKKILFGRKKIRYPKKVINEQNVQEILDYIIPIYEKNKEDMCYLLDYYRGKQPINNRVKEVRPEINNKIVTNHAYEIISFKVGYTFGEPIQYIKKSKDGPTGEIREDGAISALNELMAYDGKSVKDRRLAEWMYICGTAYRMIFPTQPGELNPFETEIVNPLECFVCYDTGFGEKPWLCGKKTEFNGLTTWTIYTDNQCFEIENSLINLKTGTTKTERKITEKKHIMGYLPIIEYPLNPSRLGAFEIVIDLLDALNNSVSNRMDGVEQFIQSFMKFVNVDIDETDFKAMKELGAIKIFSREGLQADVGIITSALDQSQTQVLVDDIYQTILQICGVPDRQASAGGNTGQALIIGQGWANAESRAKADEESFKEAEMQFLKVVRNILSMTSSVDDSLKHLNLREMEIKFNRNRTDNILTKTQALMNQLQSGVHPRIALQTSGLYSDPEEVYTTSKDYMDKKWLDNASNNTLKDKSDGSFVNTHE